MPHTLRAPVALAALSLAAVMAAAPAGAQNAPAAAPAQDTTARSQAQQAQAAPRRDRNYLSREEIDSRPAADALQVVRTLRPAWLRGARGSSSATVRMEVVVYQDGLRLGGSESLASIPMGIILGIRYYDAPTATARFGVDHGSGAIVVITQRSGDEATP